MRNFYFHVKEGVPLLSETPGTPSGLLCRQAKDILRWYVKLVCHRRCICLMSLHKIHCTLIVTRIWLLWSLRLLWSSGQRAFGNGSCGKTCAECSGTPAY